MFGDAGIRSRLNRMRDDPWETNWGGRKRRGSLQGEQNTGEPVEDDYSDFFPQFDHFNRGARTLPKRTQAGADGGKAGGFFDHIPSQFRQYIPEGFGFPSMRQPAMQTTTTRQQHPAEQQFFQQQQPTQQQQQQPQPPHPQQQYYQQQPQQQAQAQAQPPPPPERRPKTCDAGMQTDESALAFDNHLHPEQGTSNLKQHGLRNTMDMGQKSASEDNRSPRARSAPPDQTEEQQTDEANNNNLPPPPPQRAYANVTMNPQSGNASASAYATTGNHSYPQPNFNNPQQPFYPDPQQFQQRQWPPPKFQQAPQGTPPKQTTAQPQQQSPDGNFVRTVPIIIEGRGQQRPPQRQQGFTPPQSQQQQQPREVPVQQQAPPVAPQPRPAANDPISKIQQIQQDVVNLMGEVEKFSGSKKSKEYMLLDEMFTRNLLKLDDIDTQGQESIRLARKEAIKCIQALLSILEAKADESIALQAQVVPMETNETEAVPVPEETILENVEEKVGEKIDDKVEEPIDVPIEEPVGEPVVEKAQEEVVKMDEAAIASEDKQVEDTVKEMSIDEKPLEENVEKPKKKKLVKKVKKVTEPKTDEVVCEEKPVEEETKPEEQKTVEEKI